LNSMNAKIIAQEFSANKSIRICFLKIKSWTKNWREDWLKASRKKSMNWRKKRIYWTLRLKVKNLLLRSSRRILRIIIKNSLTKQKLRNRRISSKSVICRNKTIHWKQRSKVRKWLSKERMSWIKFLSFNTIRL
jgi:hypothetical protein